MSKRGNNEGSIYKRADGRWAATVSLGAGKRKTLYGRTRAEVDAKLTSVKKAHQDGLPVTSDRLTTRQYLNTWLESIRPTVRGRTWEVYESFVRVHIVPGLGHVPLPRLSPLHIRKFYGDRLNSGLSATTVGHMHALLHHALGTAQKDGFVVRNVAALVKRPQGKRKAMTTLTPEQSRDFLAAARGDRLEALYVLALSTGMREGELLALKWPQVDLEAGALQVTSTVRRTRVGIIYGEPKTEKSRRRVQLTATAVAALRTHRARQLEERLRCTHWQDADLVFATEVGTTIEARNMLRRSYYPLLARSGLPQITFHSLRHTAATLLLGQNVNTKVVSEMLGHSKVGITMDLYQHVSPSMQQAAVDAMDQVLRA